MNYESPKQCGVMFTSINQVNFVEDLKIPLPQPNEILIAIEMVGICGAESRAIRGGKKGVNATNILPGMILGHEGVGTIHSIGGNVQNFVIGDRVAILSHIPCYQCKHCFMGLTNRCLHLEHVGLTRNGSAARYVVLPAISPTVKKISLNMETRIAALVEPLSCVLHGIQKISPDIYSAFKDKIVLVLGSGTIGMIWILFSLLLGAKCVYVVDPYKKTKTIMNVIPKIFHEQAFFFNHLKQINYKSIDVAILATSDPFAGTVLHSFLRNVGMIVCFSGLNGFAPERLTDGTYGFQLTDEEKNCLNPKLFSEVHYREMNIYLLYKGTQIQLIGASGYIDQDVELLLSLLHTHAGWREIFPKIITNTVHLRDAALIYQNFGQSIQLTVGMYRSEEVVKTMICPQL